MFPNFNPVPTFAIQLSANVIDTQLEVLWQCCKAECGSYYIFSSPFSIHKHLGFEFAKPKVGEYKYGSEQIPWMYKSIRTILTLYLG